MRFQPNAELRDLLEAACLSELTADQTQRLESLVRDNAAAQDYYLRYLLLDAELALEFGGVDDAASALGTPTTLPMPSATRRRKWGRWIATLAAAVLLSIGLGAWLSRQRDSTAPIAFATLAESSGSVQVIRPSGEARPAAPGEVVEPGDTVRTGAGNSWAVVELRDASRLELDAETSLRLDDDRRVFLDEGAVRADVQGQPASRHVELTTRHARIKARGSRFNSSASEDVTIFEAESGPMEVQRGVKASVQLEPGFYAVAAADTDSVVVRRQPAPTQLARFDFPGPTRGLLFTPDGTVLITLTNQAVVSRDPRTGKRQASFDVGDSAFCMAVLPDGTVLTGGKGPLVRFWNRTAGKEVRSLDVGVTAIRQLVVSPDGRQLALLAEADGRRPEVQLWDLERSARLPGVEGETSGDNCLAFAPDSGSLAIGRPNGRVVLQPLAGDRQPATWKAHNKHVHNLAFTPDGQLVSTGQDGMIRIWDGATLQKRAEFSAPGRKAAGLAVSPDGRWVATTHADGLRLWPRAGGEPRLVALPRKRVSLLAFSRDSGRLASATWDKPGQLWDLSEMTQPD